MITASTVQESRPAQGGVWAYVSPSRLNCWIRCPRSWSFRYQEGLRTPTTPSLFVGQAVHQGLEEIYRHRMLGLNLDEADVERRMLDGWAQAIDEAGMKFTSSAEEVAIQRQAIDLVKVYLRQMPVDEPKPLAVEATVEIPLVDPVTTEDLGIPLAVVGRGLVGRGWSDDSNACQSASRTGGRSGLGEGSSTGCRRGVAWVPRRPPGSACPLARFAGLGNDLWIACGDHRRC